MAMFLKDVRVYSYQRSKAVNSQRASDYGGLGGTKITKWPMTGQHMDTEHSSTSIYHHHHHHNNNNNNNANK